jgi:PadR family transcriptional regulator, regulatory protein PadR
MARLPNTSPQTLLVLEALLEAPAAWHYGYALSRRTGLRSGTLYPLLMRLAELGWLETRWTEPERPGRPPRHTYRLSTEGARAATAQLANARAQRREAAQQPVPGIEGAGA